jgi:hypothetical protein
MKFHKFIALFSTRLSQARLTQVLLKMSSENANRCAQNAENAFGFQAEGSCFLVQERCAVGGIHATRDYTNAGSVLRNTKQST